MKFVRWYFKALGWMFIWFIPLFTLAPVILPIYDKIEPWKVAQEIIQKEHSGEVLLCCGISSGFVQMNNDVTETRQRDYFVFSGFGQSPIQLSISQVTHNGVTKVYTDDSVFGFWFFVVVWVGSIVFTWKVSIPKIRRWRNSLHENA
jgi:hypothetical protein